MESDFRTVQIQKCIKYIFLIKLLIEYYKYLNLEETEVTFKYDVLGRRIEKSIGANTTRYYYANNQVIEERDGSDVVQKQFIYGNGIDEILRVDNYDAGIPTPYYFHTNDIGSVTYNGPGKADQKRMVNKVHLL